jgi:hypothetical protein
VQGSWWMAVLEQGQWRHFEMDLGDRQHRAAFLQGQIPAGVNLA